MVVSNPKSLIDEYQKAVDETGEAWLRTQEAQMENALGGLVTTAETVISAEKDAFYQERLANLHSDVIAAIICHWGVVAESRIPWSLPGTPDSFPWEISVSNFPMTLTNEQWA